MLKLYVEVFIR